PLRDREIQKLLKSSSSASLTSEASHNASGEHVGTPAHHGSQVLITEKRHRQHPPLPRFPHSGYVRSPSWTRGGRGEQQSRDRKHHSDSENTEPVLKIERSQSQQP
ncbi:hypothetical protein cypCar_00026443, partial [Cyprinus carpio]